MTSSQTITLFTQQVDLGPRPTSIAASILLHGVTIAVVLFGLAYKPPVTNVIHEHYSVRELDLHVPDQVMRAVRDRMPLPASHGGSHASASAGNSSPAPRPPSLVAQAKSGPQTLVQPDVLKPILMAEKIPLPQVVIWSPSKTIVKKIVPPLPEKPTASNVKPAVQRPNDEMNLSDVNISSTFHPSAKSIIPPSTTSPVAIPLPQQVQLPPITASQSTAQPTPAAIVSLSDLRMKNGTVALPPVNESVQSNAQGTLAANQIQALSLPSTDVPAANSGEGSGPGSAGKASKPGPGSGGGSSAKLNNPGSGAGQAAAGKPGNPGPGSGPGSDSNSHGTDSAKAPGAPNGGTSAQGSDSGPEQNGQLTSTQITLPKDGRFGAVVVGDSLQDEYPEVSGVWNGRIAYTVYLHVGLARNWIMQYALPRAADAAAEGTVVRLDAPWPYNIVRPNLVPGSIDADAIMIHGFINQSGRFETLKMIVPQGFPQAQFVLAALSKWQFRPALQNGESARVEVLIIIPDQLD